MNPAQPAIVFRTDAALGIGTGHVMRCLTLAAALSVQGARITFVCREHDGHLCDLIVQRGFSLLRLPAVVGAQAQADPAAPHAHWLGAGWQEDAAQTRAALLAAGIAPDWLVVDHYALERRWESALRPCAARIMVIDDLADRVHDCDVLLDQNLVAGMTERYESLVPVLCRRLLGPDYVLLQPQYAVLHTGAAARHGAVRRILLFFGGVDRDGLTLRALDLLLQVRRPGVQIDVVPGGANPDLARILGLAAGQDGVQVHGPLPSLAPLMAQADLAIGAGGATSWERLCLGLPAVVVTVAANQRPVAATLAERGLIDWLGDAGALSDAALRLALLRWCDGGIAAGWFPDYEQLIDGQGAERVAGVLMEPTVPVVPVAAQAGVQHA